MLVSYRLVNENGELNGGEITLRFNSIVALKTMMQWSRDPVSDDGALRRERYILVPNCVELVLRHGEYQVQADYIELKTKLAAINEWDEA